MAKSLWIAAGMIACALAATEVAAAPAIVVIDADNGAVLFEDGGGAAHHPASLAKLMTLHLAFTAIEAGEVTLEELVSISPAAAGQGGSTLGLKTGTRLAMGTLLQAIIVRSANDAAVAVAERLAGSEQAFAQRMTGTAQKIGMAATHFQDATGLGADQQTTTARDMALLALVLRRDHPKFYPMFAMQQVTVRGAHLGSVNSFLSYPGAEGMKTGFTCRAGYNLVAAAKRGERAAISVILGATSRDERRSLAGHLTEKALSGAWRPGVSVVTVNLKSGGPVDLSAVVCKGGVVGSGAAPKGWGVELATSTSQALALKSARTAAAAQATFQNRPIISLSRPGGGLIRWRAIVAGLQEQEAVKTCLAMRAKGSDFACLVLTPVMMEGAYEDHHMLQRRLARD